MVCLPKLPIGEVLWGLAAQNGVQSPAGSTSPQKCAFNQSPSDGFAYWNWRLLQSAQSSITVTKWVCFPYLKIIMYFSDGGLASHFSYKDRSHHRSDYSLTTHANSTLLASCTHTSQGTKCSLPTKALYLLSSAAYNAHTSKQSVYSSPPSFQILLYSLVFQ